MANSNRGATAVPPPDVTGRHARPEKQQTVFQPVPIQEQVRLQGMRSQVAMSLRQCLGQCRVALKYYVLGWTGSLPREEVPDAMVNASFTRTLRERIDALDATLAPYSAGTTISIPGSGTGDNPNGSSNGNNHRHHHHPQQSTTSSPQMSMTFDLEAFNRIDYVRERLMIADLGGPPEQPLVRQVIASVVDEIEKDARVARLLPPSPSSSSCDSGTVVGECGWAWSWRYDDWFRWSASAGKWIAASREGLKVDYLI